MTTSSIRRSILLGAASAVFSRPAFSQQFPSRPIRLIVGFGAGGGTDAIARVYAQKLQEILGTPVIVENKVGASQLLAIRTVLNSPPDGYTFFLGTGSSLAQGPGVRKDLPYDPLKDFSLAGMVATAPGVFFVNPEVPVKSMGELITYAKNNPGKLNYGSAGVGAANHLQMEYMKQVTGIDLVHIPFKSDQDVTLQAASGTVHVGLTIAQAAIPMALAGKIRPLAVTGAHRLPALPDVPSLSETGVAELKGIDNYTFYGLVGPKGIPEPVIKKLNDALNTASAAPELVSKMRDSLYFEPATSTLASFNDYLVTEVTKWKELGKVVQIDMPGA
ncbi:ABC transporter substrate-binding protein [Bordetella tumbae]|uniref:Bug family tripartite tricarboxylate transporter substrate binding protein n=1 Tax=Bordetella tumbae TaxID=1649139 RepID=UPI0039EF1C3E